MSYQLRIDKRSLKVAKFISRIQSAIQASLGESGMTQQEVAEKLGVDRSVVNRRLKGKANLTARSIADFAYVLDKDIDFKLVNPRRPENSNIVVISTSSDQENKWNLSLETAVAPPATSKNVMKKLSLERVEA